TPRDALFCFRTDANGANGRATVKRVKRWPADRNGAIGQGTVPNGPNGDAPSVNGGNGRYRQTVQTVAHRPKRFKRWPTDDKRAKRRLRASRAMHPSALPLTLPALRAEVRESERGTSCRAGALTRLPVSPGGAPECSSRTTVPGPCRCCDPRKWRC